MALRYTIHRANKKKNILLHSISIVNQLFLLKKNETQEIIFFIYFWHFIIFKRRKKCATIEATIYKFTMAKKNRKKKEVSEVKQGKQINKQTEKNGKTFVCYLYSNIYGKSLAKQKKNNNSVIKM